MNHLPSIAIYATLLALLPLAAANGADAPTAAVEVANINLHDGDTITHCDLLLPFGVTLRNRSIRAFGYDAWEIDRTRQTVEVTDAEIERGKRAKAGLLFLIGDGTLWAEDSGERDPYGRVSAWLWVKTKSGQWIDVAQWMTNNNHVRGQR